MLWVIGVQVHEALATIGLALTVLLNIVPPLPGGESVGVRGQTPLILFIAWSLIAPSLAGNPPSGSGIARTIDWLTIPFVIRAASELTPRRWALLSIAAAVTLFTSSLVAGLQHFGIWPSEDFFAPLAFLKIPFSRVYEPIGESGRFMAGGLLFHRLKFAHVSALAVVAMTVAWKHHVGPSRWFVAVAGVVGFVAVWLFPYARLGAVAMTVGVALTVVLTATSLKRALVLVGALSLVGVLAIASIAPLRERFVSSFSDEGSGQRSQHLAAGLSAIQQHPIAGVGPGQFRPSKFGDASMAEHVRDNPGKAHNQLVSIAAETGVVGAGLFVLLLGSLAIRARRARYGALALGALALFVTLSLAHDPLFQAPFSMALVLLMGLGTFTPERADPSAAPAVPA
ncbi:MAG: O-antigen ligase family protein [Archangium sp.]